MNKTIAIFAVSSVLFTSCGTERIQEPPKPEPVCNHRKVEILSTNVLGKSGNDESQGAGAAFGVEAGLMVGCITGGPVGCVIGGLIGAGAGASAGTLDESIDYEAHTASGTFVCQGAKCENLEEESYRKEGNVLTSDRCYYAQ